MNGTNVAHPVKGESPAVISGGFFCMPDGYIDSGDMARLGPAATVVLCYLCRRCNAFWEAWPGHDRIAADTGMSARSVRRALAALRHAGWVAWRKGGRGITNEYRITARCPGADEPAEEPADTRTTPVLRAATRGQSPPREAPCPATGGRFDWPPVADEGHPEKGTQNKYISSPRNTCERRLPSGTRPAASAPTAPPPREPAPPRNPPPPARRTFGRNAESLPGYSPFNPDPSDPGLRARAMAWGRPIWLQAKVEMMAAEDAVARRLDPVNPDPTRVRYTPELWTTNTPSS